MKVRLIVGALLMVAVAIMILSGNSKNSTYSSDKRMSIKTQPTGPIKVTGNVKATFNPTNN